MGTTEKCIFCNNTANFMGCGNLDQKYEVSCPNCGVYYISDIIKDRDTEIEKTYGPNKHLISGLIREKNDLGLKIETITTQNITSMIGDALIPKSIVQKFDKVLLYFYRQSKQFGAWLNINENTPYSIGYAVNYEEFYKIVENLIQLGYFTQITHGGKMFQFSLSLNGVIRAEQLLATNKSSKKVFVAMGFYEELMEALEKAIKPAVRECGDLEAFIISEKEHNGDITDKIIAEIKTSKFVIADLTYNNQGAYFEAGYAQGRGLEVIRTCKKSWFEERDETGNLKNHLHFDINHYNFILWENNDDLKEKLKNRILATVF